MEILCGYLPVLREWRCAQSLQRRISPKKVCKHCLRLCFWEIEYKNGPVTAGWEKQGVFFAKKTTAHRKQIILATEWKL